MSGGSKPTQMTVDPTSPAVKPLQNMMMQAFMQQVSGAAPPGVPMQGMGGMPNLLSQLYGTPNGGPQQGNLIPPPPGIIPTRPNIPTTGMPPMRPSIPTRPVSSGSRSMRSGTGSQFPSLLEAMKKRL